MRNRILSTLVCIAALGLAQIGFAAALTDVRDTKSVAGSQIHLDMAGYTKIYAGAMVAVNASGYATNATDAAGLVVIGRAARTVDNSAGAAAALAIDVDLGTFIWDLSTATTNAGIVGSLAYVVDNHTVTIAAGPTPSAYIIAGTVVYFDYVNKTAAVLTGNLAGQQALTPATLGVAGAATVGTTLSVSGATTGAGATWSGIEVDAGHRTLGTAYVSGAMSVTGVLTHASIPVMVGGTSTGTPQTATGSFKVTILGTNYSVNCSPSL